MSETTPEREVTDVGTIPSTVVGEDTSGNEAASEERGLVIPSTVIGSEETGPTTISASEFTRADVGTFSVRYRGAVPQLVVTGGTVVPSVLTVVDGSGNVLANYTAGPATPPSKARRIPEDQNELGCATPDCLPYSLRK
ncbi:hypothetical protein ACQPW1_14715 [Nocardia sp. CA-128927]|uniref:hypothetical protein n=1 Tax=Nocardia sp. CA-128927 TaxID=3239975 RepID=UPI003D99044D